jgi:hypothetical protein
VRFFEATLGLRGQFADVLANAFQNRFSRQRRMIYKIASIA